MLILVLLILFPSPALILLMLAAPNLVLPDTELTSLVLSVLTIINT